MAKLIWISTSGDPCPSCIALNGQVHEEGEWEGLIPKDSRLYCQEHCTCHMSEVEGDDKGEIDNVPLRHSTGISDDELGEKPMDEFTFQMQASPTDDGFDMLAINEGEAKGHGITFASAVLQEAMPLYVNKPVFIDHPGIGQNPSVRNLAGTLHSASWNSVERGIALKLKPSGPAASILVDIRNAAKDNPAIMQAVGFSTVLNVQLNAQREVTKIVHVKSVDVVVDPARGGKFLSALDNSIAQKETQMSEKETQAEAKLQESAAQVKTLQLQLLDQTLKASGLPELSQKAVKKSLAGVDALTSEMIETAITEKREELAEIGKGNSIQGPSRITRMVNSDDQFRLAVEDLLGVEREAAEKDVRVHRLTGIREAYLKATGDMDFVGGYHPEFALVTGNFPGIVANVQNKILTQAWDRLRPVYGWWEKIVTIEHFNTLNDVSWLKVGTIASLPTVAEQGAYTELNIGDNRETSSFEKFGGYVPITLEAILRDDVRAFTRMPQELALAGMRNISEQVAEIFTISGSKGPILADTGYLFNATAVVSGSVGGHANLLTTALGTDFVAWDAAATAMYNQPLLVKNDTGYYGTGKKMGIEPRYCLVPRALKAQAEALFVPRWATSVEAVATKGGPSYAGIVEPLTVPEWTDATDWAAVADPMLVPGIMIGEIFGVKPQIFSASSEIDPAMFTNDESRIKVRQLLAVGVADFRGLHKNNVA